MAIKSIALTALTFVMSTGVYAVTLVEDFEEPFPAWESGWLGLNSNIQNYFTPRGGPNIGGSYLWITDDDAVNGFGDNAIEIHFDVAFGLSLTSFSIDIETLVNTSMQIYDGSGAVILEPTLNTGVGFETVSVPSINGISGFSLFSADQIEGSTKIDNVIASTVPVPAAAWLFGSGLLGLIGFAGRKAV